jgi:exopolyphosphatase/guanosine-5'-triphosphate,3'-diphosphate pyrophosphatase
LVFTGGTATTLVSVKEGWERYDPEQVHGQILERRDIEDLYRMLAGMSLSLRSRLPGLQPERADIIPAGTLIILLIMEVLGKTRITVSENDLLQGIIWGINS